ncbi:MULTISPECIES: IclR family transcriptional regulator [Streptomyces]|uniref:IclR family transcriptional regulator n=1 Tax=Streptomyces TaxID=1883 RepID=UPI0019033887|nr:MULTISPECIES: IclR family transcriptional regulator C-terminal domain-containing protein [unclassified Streptomyces]MCU4746663.1 helix-turn-helix domain-containing protein [Streptomyces sp. G-5]QQN77389.1 helix-turn-helix domain-containing protein [Streptomyces sp. XC 2026]
MAITPGLTAPFHSVQYALRLLETVAGHPDGIPENEIAEHIDLPPGQLSHLLLMLTREGYVHQLRDGAYLPGEALILLSRGGDRQQVRHEKLQEALDALRVALGAAVYIGLYRDGELEVPHVSDAPETPPVHQWVDFRSAAHATAIGKCLLSQLDHDGRQDHFSRHRAARLTSRTITDARVLLNSLERQPATMPVLDLQEYAVGTLCAAVPLTAGSTVGCLALSLPVGEAHRLRQAAETLNRKAAPALLSLAL